MGPKWRGHLQFFIFLVMSLGGTYGLYKWSQMDPPSKVKKLNTHLAVGTKEEIKNYQSFVLQKKESIRRCFLTLPNKPDDSSNGQITLNWIVDKTGKAKDIQIKKDDFANPKLTRCLTGLVGSIDFPSPQDSLKTIQFTFGRKSSPTQKPATE